MALIFIGRPSIAHAVRRGIADADSGGEVLPEALARRERRSASCGR
jgi:hypothetical protein